MYVCMYIHVCMYKANIIYIYIYESNKKRSLFSIASWITVGELSTECFFLLKKIVMTHLKEKKRKKGRKKKKGEGEEHTFVKI